MHYESAASDSHHDALRTIQGVSTGFNLSPARDMLTDAEDALARRYQGLKRHGAEIVGQAAHSLIREASDLVRSTQAAAQQKLINFEPALPDDKSTAPRDHHYIAETSGVQIKTSADHFRLGTDDAFMQTEIVSVQYIMPQVDTTVVISHAGQSQWLSGSMVTNEQRVSIVVWPAHSSDPSEVNLGQEGQDVRNIALPKDYDIVTDPGATSNALDMMRQTCEEIHRHLPPKG